MFIQRMLVILLIPVLLIASVGYSVDFHYCQGNLKSFSFTGKAESCHIIKDGKSKSSCPFHSYLPEKDGNESILAKSCCENQTHQFNSDIDQNLNGFDFECRYHNLQPLSLLGLFPEYSFNIFAGQANNFLSYKPPVIITDIPVRVQSFLL